MKLTREDLVKMLNEMDSRKADCININIYVNIANKYAYRAIDLDAEKDGKFVKTLFHFF